MGQRGTTEPVQFELGGEASGSGFTPSGSLGDHGARHGRGREEAGRPLRVCRGRGRSPLSAASPSRQ